MNSDEDKKEIPEAILTVLKTSNLLDEFVKDVERLGHCGEELNKKLLCLAAVSSKRNRPISIVCQGESGSGKSTSVEKVIECFPDEDVIDITALSPKALYNMNKNALKNKIIVIGERNGAEGADYPIRAMQSERKLKRLIAVQAEGGNWITKLQEVEGPACFIQTTTSTQSDRNAENETRVFTIFSDDSAALTDRVFEIQNCEYSLEGSITEDEKKEIRRRWKSVFRCLQPLEVKIPFAEHIKFPNIPVRVRRDRSRFLVLIEVSAHFYQFQRERIQRNGQEIIIASSEDYAVAYELLTPVLQSNLEGLSLKLKQLCDFVIKKQARVFTYANLEDWSDWNRKTIMKYVTEGMDVGVFEATEPIRQGVEAVFNFFSSKIKKVQGLPTPDELKIKLEDGNLSNCPNGMDKPMDKLR